MALNQFNFKMAAAAILDFAESEFFTAKSIVGHRF